MNAAGFLGCGWRFPVEIADRPAVGPSGTRVSGLQYAEGAAKVQQSIRVILETSPGERVMRPTFGCGLRRHLMKPNTVAERALIRAEVETALATWEPRIRLTSVDVQAGDDPARVDIFVNYVHVRDGRPGNLVYPFYLE